jgi:hypothetical protein
MRASVLFVLGPAIATVGVSASSALALVPRVAICGRVTSFTPAQPPNTPIVRLGTQEPRHLAIGGAFFPQLGEEVCIWGVDVENVNPPVPDPAPKGIAQWQMAAVSWIGCADQVTATSAFFTMPGESASPLPNRATLTLPLTAPAGNGCVRIAVDAQGNPVAVLLPAMATAAPTPTARASVGSLPSTSAGWTAARLRWSRSEPSSPRSCSPFVARARYHRDGRARRGASGALYPQSALAGLNPLPRSGIADPARVRRR